VFATSTGTSFVLLPASGSTYHVVMFVRAVMCADAKYDLS